MDYTIAAATKITMWRGLGLHLCLGLVLTTYPIFGTAVSNALGSREGAVQQEQQEQQVAPFVVPQWWWLSSLLSLPHGHHGYTTPADAAEAAAAARKVAGDTEESPVSEDEASTLSLMLPLEQLTDGKESVSSPSVAKRGALCRGAGRRACRRGAVTNIPVAEVTKNWEAEYLSIPESLVSFSQKQTEEAVCKDLSVQLFEVDLWEEDLKPLWVRKTVHLGVCPSMLQERRLGNDVWPSRVVEVKCLCQQQSCSSFGGDFRCQAVRRSVRTWVRSSEKTFVPSQEIVSVGCVCVQRTSTQARLANLVEG